MNHLLFFAWAWLESLRARKFTATEWRWAFRIEDRPEWADLDTPTYRRRGTQVPVPASAQDPYEDPDFGGGS